jgi:hypothetical protein
MRQAAIVAIGICLLPTLGQAKEKDRTFNQPCSVVFPAAEKMASEKPYKLQLDAKADMNLIVEIGSFWKAGASQIIVRFVASDDNKSCTVVDNSPYSGVRRNGTVFLDRLEKQLIEATPGKQAELSRK